MRLSPYFQEFVLVTLAFLYLLPRLDLDERIGNAGGWTPRVILSKKRKVNSFRRAIQLAAGLVLAARIRCQISDDGSVDNELEFAFAKPPNALYVCWAALTNKPTFPNAVFRPQCAGRYTYEPSGEMRVGDHSLSPAAISTQ